MLGRNIIQVLQDHIEDTETTQPVEVLIPRHRAHCHNSVSTPVVQQHCEVLGSSALRPDIKYSPSEPFALAICLLIKGNRMFSDTHLYALACAGDRSAFDSLYKKYSRPLFNFILRYTQNRQDAEEILSDVFLTFFKSSGLKFANDTALKAWLYQVSRNQSLNSLKRDKMAGKVLAFFPSQEPTTERPVLGDTI